MLPTGNSGNAIYGEDVPHDHEAALDLPVENELPSSTSWNSNTSDADNRAGPHETYPTQRLDANATHPEYSAESSADYNSYATPPAAEDAVVQPYQAISPNISNEVRPSSRVSSPIVNPALSLATSFRANSPHQKALPPSPTLSQSHGRASPFLEHSLVNTKRTASPRSFVEPIKEHAEDTTMVAKTRSPVVSPTMRTSSPAPAYLNGARNAAIGSINPYLPKSVAGEERASSPALSGQQSMPSDPYAPKTYLNGHKAERAGSPSSFAGWSAPSALPSSKHHPPTNTYAPQRADLLRNRSMSNSSMLSTASTSAEDPYAPSQYNKRIPSEADYGSYSSRYNYPNGNGTDPSHLPPLTSEYPAQELPLKPFHTPYAPSPSLMGANDPLGRTAARIPVFSFGFGGKLVTCFHGADSLSTGFDVALASRNSTGIHIRTLKTLIPESALDTSTAVFPGPLFSDPGTATTSLVRAGPTTQTKTKKSQVIKYLSERTDELALGLRYLRPDTLEGRRAEGKLVLVKLLQIMVEHDGRLTGTYVYLTSCTHNSVLITY